MSPTKMEVTADYVNSLLGLELAPERIAGLLEMMRFGAKASGNKILVDVPSYRADVLHPIDLVEDVAIAYGYMEFTPKVPKLYALGKADDFELYCERVRDLAVGLGFSEVMTLMLSNERDQFIRMNMEPQPAIEAEKAVSADQGMPRTWLLPSLLVVLEKNRNREYPQSIFEVGQCLTSDGKVKTVASGVIAATKTNFAEIKASFSGLLSGISIDPEFEPHDHPSFIEGRCAGCASGFFGEIHPAVLEAYGLEVPVTAFELEL